MFNLYAKIPLQCPADKTKIMWVPRRCTSYSFFSFGIAGIERHQGRVIKLEYEGKGDIKSTYMFVGKVRNRHSVTVAKLYDSLPTK